jgi:hypothetical protein
MIILINTQSITMDGSTNKRICMNATPEQMKQRKLVEDQIAACKQRLQQSPESNNSTKLNFSRGGVPGPMILQSSIADRMAHVAADSDLSDQATTSPAQRRVSMEVRLSATGDDFVYGFWGANQFDCMVKDIGSPDAVLRKIGMAAAFEMAVM